MADEKQVDSVIDQSCLSLYEDLIRTFFKQDTRQQFLDDIHKYYDPSVVANDDLSNCIHKGCYSDGTLLFLYQQECFALLEAICICRKDSGNRFGNMIADSKLQRSPDPNKPWMRDHMTVDIPMIK